MTASTVNNHDGTLESARTALAAAEERAQHTRRQVTMATEFRDATHDRLRGGDEDVSTDDLLSVQAAVDRAEMLSEAAAARLAPARDRVRRAELDQVVEAARDLATSGQPALVHAARLAVKEAQRHAEQVEVAYRQVVVGMARRLFDAGAPLGPTGTGWMGRRTGVDGDMSPDFTGFVVEGHQVPADL